MEKKAKFKLCVIVSALFLICSSSQVFAALILNPAQPITHIVTVQPIIVSDDDGDPTSTANYFGNAMQEIQYFGIYR